MSAPFFLKPAQQRQAELKFLNFIVAKQTPAAAKVDGKIKMAVMLMDQQKRIVKLLAQVAELKKKKAGLAKALRIKDGLVVKAHEKLESLKQRVKNLGNMHQVAKCKIQKLTAHRDELLEAAQAAEAAAEAAQVAKAAAEAAEADAKAAEAAEADAKAAEAAEAAEAVEGDEMVAQTNKEEEDDDRGDDDDDDFILIESGFDNMACK